MALPYESRSDGTVTFLPHRLNHQPVVVRGLTADELWICAGLSAAAGLLVGIPLALLLSTIALVPTLVVVGIALGVFVGGAVMRRQKRNRPETWQVPAGAVVGQPPTASAGTLGRRAGAGHA